MKKLLLLATVLLMTLCFASCGIKETSVDVTEPFITTYCARDSSGRVIKHIVFNQDTKLTYIIDYEWSYDGCSYICTSQRVTILDENGHEVAEDSQVSINGCTCVGSSGDASNNYPGYLIQ